MKTKVKYITNVEKVEELSEGEKKIYTEISEKYAFRTNSYYNNLIDWSDENDPLRKIVIPDKDETINWGELDASSESAYTKVPGLEHKYNTTALLLCNDVCAAYCRFCFRKRLFQSDNEEVEKDVWKGIEYIKEHSEINNVLLTGGDPLMLSTKRLIQIFEELKQIPHVKIVRLGTKVLGFNPFRVLEDELFLEMLEKYSESFQIYFMLHYNHPTELTKESIDAIRAIKKRGVTTVNQTPIIKGVNDDPEVLGKLMEELSFVGVIPYYIFTCRPTEGNFVYAVPIEEGFRIFQESKKTSSGLAKTARFVMSHSTGKIEVLSINNGKVILKKHNFPDQDDNEEIMIYDSNPEAYWFDDYTNLVALPDLETTLIV
ncbi:KamA family radical SAM protein [Flavobacterium sp.]|uniref:KamA family radical SAM protein n=1 Tax=Flavobacterium sp. TaxID=239 RepID=UPI003D0B0815